MSVDFALFAGHSPAPFECIEGVIYDARRQAIAEITPLNPDCDIDGRLLTAAPEMLAEVSRLLTENGLLREALNQEYAYKLGRVRVALAVLELP